MSEETSHDEIVNIPSSWFLGLCGLLSVILLMFGHISPFPAWFCAVEVCVTVLGLFVFGSIRYRLDKNALTYGSCMVVASTFWWSWWPRSFLHQEFETNGWSAVGRFLGHYALTLDGLDQLIHADTMLFILGLTLFVAVIAQTRLLETISFRVLEKTKGSVVMTVAILIGLVAFSSAILGGVSMIGLMIRTLVIILFLANQKDDAVIYAVIVSTIITTVCGMWLSYGEPPNLIMQVNLHPYLSDYFFLTYCLPVAVGSFFIVLWNVRRRLDGKIINISTLDILDLNTADVRFLQSSRHGTVLTPIEFVEDNLTRLGIHYDSVIQRLHHGDPLGHALVAESVPQGTRRSLLGEFVSEDLADVLDQHYLHNQTEKNDVALVTIKSALEHVRKRRIQSQTVGALSFLPFVALLVWHVIDPSLPLFWASFVGFGCAFAGIASLPKTRQLALHEAKVEYMEYLFLLPLFFSIMLLQKSGFFDQLSSLLKSGIEHVGAAHIAFLQFWSATILSAMLDNNIVADFAARALHGLDLGTMRLFAMSQIAGYGLGGCWTHVGSAQSVVAYAFILKEVNERFTPFQWMKWITPVILQISLWIALVVYGEAWMLSVMK